MRRTWRRIWLLLPAMTLIACGDLTAVPGASVPGDFTAFPVTTGGQSPLTSSGTTAIPAGATSAPTPPPATFRPPEPLLVGSAVQVAVAELNLRQAPSPDARRVALLTPDHLLGIGVGPVNAGGYTWYEAEVISSNGEMPALGSAPVAYDDRISGWVAVARRTTPYVVRVPPRCADTIDIAHLASMLPAELLVCFGRSTLDLEGVYGCPGICEAFYPGTYEPSWLAQPVTFSLLRPYPIQTSQFPVVVTVRFPPDGPPAPGRGAIVRIRGHFDDDHASSCSIAILPPGSGDEVPLIAEASELVCRQRFVVEGYSIIGVDPDFQLE